MYIDSGAFRITRTAGAGDRERVRSTLLQVLMLDEDSLYEQFQGVHEACRKLGFRMRAHISSELRYSELFDKINFELLGKWRSDDTDVVRHKGDRTGLAAHVDLVIQRIEGEVIVKDIENGVIEVMTKAPRQLIKGDHQQLPVRELKVLYLEWYPDMNNF